MTRRVLLCLALAGCAATPGREVTYLCDGGRLAVVAFSGETARVRLASDSVELKGSPSGTRYAGARGQLDIRGDEALLTIDHRQLGPCQEVKPKS